jgi:acyl-CoA synthetase (NDP forming)
MSINEIENIFKNAEAQGRKALSEVEVYEIFAKFDLTLPDYIYKKSEEIEPEKFADEILSKIKTEKAVIKIVSHKTLHKTDSGGVKIVELNHSLIAKKIQEMIANFKDIDGILACSFIEHSAFALGEELLLGARSDDAFGPILTLGPGGTNSEGLAKALKYGYGISVMPVNFVSNRKSIEDFIKNIWVLKYCEGEIRGSKKILDDSNLIKWIETFAYLMKNFNDFSSSVYTIEEMEVNPLCVHKNRLYALDGVLRFRRSVKKERNKPSSNAITSIIKPKTIAVIGVSEKKMNMGRIILNNIIKAGFDKEKIYVIKEGVKEIDGIKCFSRVSEVSEAIDMYVIAVPSQDVPSVIKDAANGKVNGIVLISGGMGEKSGSENVAKDVIDTIKQAREKNPNFALSGGNSLGIVLNESKVNTLFIPEYKMEYPIGFNSNMCKTAFISQSGAFVISTLSKMPHIKPLYSITVGNQQDITVVDYVERLIEEDIKLLLVYIEGFKYGDGLNFLKVINKAREKGKYIIVYKAGRTAVGQKAVMGHTASIAGDYTVSKILMEKAGALVCEDFDEFCDMAYLFSYFSNYELKNKNTFFISNAGFETAGMADSISSLVPMEIDKNTYMEMEKILKEHKLDSIVDIKNPMDITPMAGDAAIEAIISKVMQSDKCSSIIVSMVPLTAAMHTLSKNDKWPDDMEKNSFLIKISAIMKELKKPVIFCVASGELYNPYCRLAMEKGFVVFRSADRAVKYFEKFVNYKLIF